jgi:predicted nucleotidyltransferase
MGRGKSGKLGALMLSDRIISTLRFFELQEMPLTAFEVHKYLVAQPENLKERLDGNFELLPGQEPGPTAVHLDTVQHYLDEFVESGSLEESCGLYFLPGKLALASKRLKSYLYGVRRERLIWRYLARTRHIPFVRGIALAGSQAMGLQRKTSDIDLLILTDKNYMWIARTFLTVYFQTLGVRRYGKKIANRFCLNHYLANIREVDAERNLYKAMEYTKLRSVVYPQNMIAFQQANEGWIRLFFPNVEFRDDAYEPQSPLQSFLENMFLNRFGKWLENKMGQWQLGRIKQGKYIFVRHDELSFHPESKHEALLKGFFEK